MLIKLLVYVLSMICSAMFIYGTGKVMLIISDRYSKYEWVNKVLAVLDIIAITMIVMLILQIIALLIPFSIVLLLILLVTFITELIFKSIKKYFRG